MVPEQPGLEQYPHLLKEQRLYAFLAQATVETLGEQKRKMQAFIMEAPIISAIREGENLHLSALKNFASHHKVDWTLIDLLFKEIDSSTRVASEDKAFLAMGNFLQTVIQRKRTEIILSPTTAAQHWPLLDKNDPSSFLTQVIQWQIACAEGTENKDPRQEGLPPPGEILAALENKNKSEINQHLLNLRTVFFERVFRLMPSKQEILTRWLREIWLEARKENEPKKRINKFIWGYMARMGPLQGGGRAVGVEAFKKAKQSLAEIIGDPEAIRLTQALQGEDTKGFCVDLDQFFAIESNLAPAKPLLAQDYLATLGARLRETSPSREEIPFALVLAHFEQDEKIRESAKESALRLQKEGLASLGKEARKHLQSLADALGMTLTGLTSCVLHPQRNLGTIRNIGLKVGFLTPMKEGERKVCLQALQDKILGWEITSENVLLMLLIAQLEREGLAPAQAQEKAEKFKKGELQETEVILAVEKLAEIFNGTKSAMTQGIRDPKKRKIAETALKVLALQINSDKEGEMKSKIFPLETVQAAWPSPYRMVLDQFMVILIDLAEPKISGDQRGGSRQIWHRLAKEGGRGQATEMEQVWKEAESLLKLDQATLKRACLEKNPLEAGQRVCRQVGIQMEGFNFAPQEAVSNLATGKTREIRKRWPPASRMLADQWVVTLLQLHQLKIENLEDPYFLLKKLAEKDFREKKKQELKPLWQNLKGIEVPPGRCGDLMRAQKPEFAAQAIREKVLQGKTFGDLMPLADLIYPFDKEQVLARMEERLKASPNKLPEDPYTAFFYTFILSYLDLWPMVQNAATELEKIKNGDFGRMSEEEKIVWRRMFALGGLGINCLGKLGSEQNDKKNGEKILKALGTEAQFLFKRNLN